MERRSGKKGNIIKFNLFPSFGNYLAIAKKKNVLPSLIFRRTNEILSVMLKNDSISMG